MPKCTDGCGAPLIDGVCEHCGITYPEPTLLVSLDDLRDFLGEENITITGRTPSEPAMQDLPKDNGSLKDEEEEWDRSTERWQNEIYGTDNEPEIVAMSHGPGYDPDLGTSSFVGDQKSVAGWATLMFVATLLSYMFGYYPFALICGIICLSLGLIGLVRQIKENRTQEA